MFYAVLTTNLPKSLAMLINLGGVANVTWLGTAGEVIACDVGPKNAPLDSWEKTCKQKGEKGRKERREPAAAASGAPVDAPGTATSGLADFPGDPTAVEGGDGKEVEKA